jgi:hypothetical protein
VVSCVRFAARVVRTVAKSFGMFVLFFDILEERGDETKVEKDSQIKRKISKGLLVGECSQMDEKRMHLRRECRRTLYIFFIRPLDCKVHCKEDVRELMDLEVDHIDITDRNCGYMVRVLNIGSSESGSYCILVSRDTIRCGVSPGSPGSEPLQAEETDPLVEGGACQQLVLFRPRIFFQAPPLQELLDYFLFSV